MKMSNNLLLLVLSYFILAELNTVKPEKHHPPGMPKNIECEDRNLQRNLTWRLSKPKKSWKLSGFKVEHCFVQGCTNKATKCYEDNLRQHEVKNFTQPLCKTSVKQMPPFYLFQYVITAIYQTPKKIIERKKTKICERIESEMSLDSPNVDVDLSTTSISLRSALPRQLTSAINDSEDYDLNIKHHFCVHKIGEICTDKNTKAGCSTDAIYSNLDEGTDYAISVWYTAKTTHLIESEITTKNVTTLVDLFPPGTQILLAIGISIFAIAVIVSMILARAAKKVLKKMDEMVNKKIPTHLEKALEDINKNSIRSKLSKKRDFNKCKLPPMTIQVDMNSEDVCPEVEVLCVPDKIPSDPKIQELAMVEHDSEMGVKSKDPPSYGYSGDNRSYSGSDCTIPSYIMKQDSMENVKRHILISSTRGKLDSRTESDHIPNLNSIKLPLGGRIDAHRIPEHLFISVGKYTKK